MTQMLGSQVSPRRTHLLTPPNTHSCIPCFYLMYLFN